MVVEEPDKSLAERFTDWRRHYLPLPDEVVGEYLAEDEYVVHTDHPSFRAFLIQNMIPVALATVMLPVVFAFVRMDLSGWWILLIILVLDLVLLVLAMRRLSQRYTSYVITNLRLIRVSGIIGRKLASIPWTRMTGLGYRQKPIGRLMGFATIFIESANEESGLREFSDINDPAKFHQMILDMVSSKAGPKPEQPSKGVRRTLWQRRKDAREKARREAEKAALAAQEAAAEKAAAAAAEGSDTEAESESESKAPAGPVIDTAGPAEAISPSDTVPVPPPEAPPPVVEAPAPPAAEPTPSAGKPPSGAVYIPAPGTAKGPPTPPRGTPTVSPDGAPRPRRPAGTNPKAKARAPQRPPTRSARPSGAPPPTTGAGSPPTDTPAPGRTRPGRPRPDAPAPAEAQGAPPTGRPEARRPRPDAPPGAGPLGPDTPTPGPPRARRPGTDPPPTTGAPPAGDTGGPATPSRQRLAATPPLRRREPGDGGQDEAVRVQRGRGQSGGSRPGSWAWPGGRPPEEDATPPAGPSLVDRLKSTMQRRSSEPTADEAERVSARDAIAQVRRPSRLTGKQPFRRPRFPSFGRSKPKPPSNRQLPAGSNQPDDDA